MTHDHQAVRLNRGELWTWMAIALALAALYPPTVLGGLAAIGAATVVAWINPRISIDGRATAAFVAVASWPVFFSWRTNLLNADGTMLTPKFQRDVPLLGAHLTHDELLELFLHSRVWYYTSRWRGWSVVFSYQMVSCIAGCVFIYALVRLSRRLAPERTWLFLLGMLSGGYMQLFFGDVENYTVTAAIVMLYVLAAWRYIAREAPLWAPILGLAIAMCFHLETAWLLPSAVYLCTLSRSRTASLRETWSSTALGAATIAAVFVYFHFHGLPLRRFFSSHAGNALRANGVFAIGMPSSYYVDQ